MLNERGNLAAIEVAELGQEAEQGGGQLRAHARDALQEFIRTIAIPAGMEDLT